MEPDTKEILMLKRSFVEGKKVDKGAKLKVSIRDARFLVNTKCAEYVEPAEKKAAAAKKGVTSRSGLK